MGTVILVLISVLNEKQNAALALSVALLTSSAVLLLYSIKGRSLRLLSFLGALGISGLPFTPASAGWDGLVSGDLNFWQILLVFSVAMMVAGYLKHGTRMSSEFRTFEGWVRALYPAGIFLVILMQWIIVLLGINRGFTNANWWAPLTVVLFLGFALIWRLMIQNPEKRSSFTYDLYSQLSELNYRLDRIFQIETIERVLDKIIGAIHWIANFVTRLFESSGGILWSLLVLVIFFIVLGSGGR